MAAERMTRRPSRPAERATDREVGVVAAVLVAGSEKAAAHRLGLSHSTVKHRLANARSKLDADGRARRYAETTWPRSAARPTTTIPARLPARRAP
jgi:DNA-binding NarL/FixJ family response regulator